MTKFFVATLLLTAAFSAHAVDADDIASTNTERRPIEELFKTDTVYPQDAGELEVEVASLFQKHTRGNTFSFPLSLEYGLTSKWQVEAEWDSFIQHDPAHGRSVSGIGDLELGTQYSFLNIDDSLWHVAPRFSVELPLGDVNTDLSEGFVEYEPAVVIARDVPQWHDTHLFSEIGFSFVQRVKRPADSDDAEPPAHELNLGGGFFTMVPHGAVTMELNWDNNRWNHHGDENDLYVTPGFLWRVIPGVEAGVGVPVGLNGSSDRYQVAAHVVVEF